MKTKLTIPVIILLSIIMLGCKNRSNIKSTTLSEEAYLYLYSNDTLIITTADGPNIDDKICKAGSSVHTRKYLENILNDYEIVDWTNPDSGPPYVLMFCKGRDTLSFFADVQQIRIFEMMLATFENPTVYFDKYSVGVTTTKDILNYYDIDIDNPINYIIIGNKSDYPYIKERNRFLLSDSIILVLYFYHDVLKKIIIKKTVYWDYADAPHIYI